MKYLFFLVLPFLLACSQSKDQKISNINGYWEIAEIENEAGEVKAFTISQNIDFFEINPNGKGIRKKVQPNALGEFVTSNSSENIDVIEEDGLFKLQYSTALDTWIEIVKKATKEELVLINEAGIIYTYRKYKPLALE
ncbi:hypothetical protein [Dokdonia sp. Hel_I_53]|uniref:hypothetical protein n=1 Tax=Dokdonia sp. Hel_I_53 TaxID=1566287 RepID=UPI00119BE8D9|nr:hypothetical protein [Dokdonia sp. Hel_I_53]TVZ53224.1 hypothetical protein OD90_2424 [Dokdonia sp. Hel_I_53]